MVSRPIACLTCLAVLALAGTAAGQGTEHWKDVEIVTFTDFDDMDVKLEGKPCKAFLVGLRPLRETVKARDELNRLRKKILGKLRKNGLSARVMTRRGAVVGLSIDTFMHHRNDFGHPWNPNEYPYCWTGWGAYNFNTYYLYTKTTRFQDNFGKNKIERDRFAEVACTMQGAERAAVLIKGLGDKRFKAREAASNALRTIGSPAVGPLRKATASSDFETRRRAERILQAIAAQPPQKGQTKTAWAVSGK